MYCPMMQTHIKHFSLLFLLLYAGCPAWFYRARNNNIDRQYFLTGINIRFRSSLLLEYCDLIIVENNCILIRIVTEVLFVIIK